jgi:hypothetical protein
LIFKYSELNCNVCIDSQIIIVKKLANIISPQKIIFLSSYNQNSNLYRFKRLNSIKSEIYNIHDGLGLNIDTLNVPYYFIMSPECRISNVFIPDKMDMEMTIRYIETIKRYFIYNQ